jgi:ribosome-associated protein
MSKTGPVIAAAPGKGLSVSGLFIPEAELSERFIQASGPGGQNVNKVASAVQLSFDVGSSSSLPGPVRAALLKLGGARLSKDGVLILTARKFREQERNRADARARLAELIRQAATPRKTRRPTRVPKASKVLRINAKKRRAGLKKERSRPYTD